MISFFSFVWFKIILINKITDEIFVRFGFKFNFEIISCYTLLVETLFTKKDLNGIYIKSNYSFNFNLVQFIFKNQIDFFYFLCHSTNFYYKIYECIIHIDFSIYVAGRKNNKLYHLKCIGKIQSVVFFLNLMLKRKTYIQ